MHEDCELVRQPLTASLSAKIREPTDLEAQYVEALRFLAPSRRARRRDDGVEGLLVFRRHAQGDVASEATPARS